MTASALAGPLLQRAPGMAQRVGVVQFLFRPHDDLLNEEEEEEEERAGGG